MLTVIGILVLAAFIFTSLSAVRPWAPLWAAVLLLCIVELVRILPLGK